MQAAEVLSGRSDLTLVEVEGDDAAATVRFAGGDGEHRIRVRRAAEPVAVLKSCGDDEAKPVRPYQAEPYLAEPYPAE